MSSYSFSDDAVQDLDEICEYIARNNYGAASKLFETHIQMPDFFNKSGI